MTTQRNGKDAMSTSDGSMDESDVPAAQVRAAEIHESGRRAEKTLKRARRRGARKGCFG